MAISIPIFTSQLEKAREATDLANLRAAKAAAAVAYLSDSTTGGVTFGSQQTGAVSCFYNTADGQLVAADKANQCGKGTTADGGTADTAFGTFTYKAVPTTTYKDNYIKVSVTKEGVVTCEFVEKTT